MSVPLDPIIPPLSPPPLDNPPSGPGRVPGEKPLPDPEPDERAASTTRYSHCSPWGLLCHGVRLQSEDLH
jgi:hypothetical protein